MSERIGFGEFMGFRSLGSEGSGFGGFYGVVGLGLEFKGLTLTEFRI